MSLRPEQWWNSREGNVALPWPESFGVLCGSWAVSLLLALGGAGAQAADCDGHYFSSGESGEVRALARPSRPFAEMLARARGGQAVEQRNLAICYEVGYLVSRCEERAAYWYRKAAASGDAVAQAWIGRRSELAASADAPECAEAACANRAEASPAETAVLHASAERNGHFFAPIVINGQRARGMIDTGATTISMSEDAAKKFGILTKGGKTGSSSTANGTISVTLVIVPLVEVAGIKVRNVPVSIGITGDILIGMSFLRQVNVSMGSGTLTLAKRR